MHVEEKSLDGENGWSLSSTSGTSSGRAIVCAGPAPRVSAGAGVLTDDQVFRRLLEARGQKRQMD